MVRLDFITPAEAGPRSTGTPARPPVALLPSAVKPRLRFICVIVSPVCETAALLIDFRWKTHLRTNNENKTGSHLVLIQRMKRWNNRKYNLFFFSKFVPIIKVIPVKYSCLYRAAVFLCTSVRCHPSSAYEKQITKTWFQSVWFLFHFLSDEFSYQRCEKQKVICSLELKFPGETVVTDDVSSRQIARRGRDLSMSQGSFYSCVQISVCIYFSRHWSLNPAPDLLSSFMDEHTTTVSVLILYTVLYIMLFFLPITRRPFDEKQRKKKKPFLAFFCFKTFAEQT